MSIFRQNQRKSGKNVLYFIRHKVTMSIKRPAQILALQNRQPPNGALGFSRSCATQPSMTVCFIGGAY